MRKRTIKFTADLVFWYILYFLPVMVYLFYMLAQPSQTTNLVNLEQLFTTCGFEFVSNNIIFTNLTDIFGANGILPLFQDIGIFYVFTWFISVYLCHLLVDFLLFIPRLAHKYLNLFTQGD